MVVNKKRARTMAQYKIVDNVNGLTEEDWTRVVAVFVNGPEWELKKFPWYKKFGGVPGVLSRSESCFLFLLHLMRFFFFSFFFCGDEGIFGISAC